MTLRNKGHGQRDDYRGKRTDRGQQRNYVQVCFYEARYGDNKISDSCRCAVMSGWSRLQAPAVSPHASTFIREGAGGATPGPSA